MSGLLHIKVEGLKELEAQLLELQATVAVKALAQAARKAFMPVLEAAKANVPVDSGAVRDGLKLAVRKPSSGDAVVAVGIRIGGGPRPKGIAAIAAKYERRFGGAALPPARRWHWIEFGTAHTAAHPFLRTAMDSKSGAVIELLKTELVKSIARAIAKKAKG